MKASVLTGILVTWVAIVLLLNCVSCIVTINASPKKYNCHPNFLNTKMKTACGCQEEFSNRDFYGKPVSTGPAKLWTRGQVFYDIDKAFDAWYRDKIIDTLAYLEKVIGRQHIELIYMRNKQGQLCKQKHYVFVKRNEAFMCDGPVGRQDGVTTLLLDQDTCSEEYSIVFPMVGIMGMQFEWNRSDRDKHINIKRNEIFVKDCGSFKPRSVPDATETLPYDYDSIMHLYSCQSSCQGEYTMLRPDGTPIKNNFNLTELDVAKLRLLYPKDKKFNRLPEGCGLKRRDYPEEDSGPKPLAQTVIYIDNGVKFTAAWQLTAFAVAMATICIEVT